MFMYSLTLIKHIITDTAYTLIVRGFWFLKGLCMYPISYWRTHETRIYIMNKVKVKASKQIVEQRNALSFVLHKTSLDLCVSSSLVSAGDSVIPRWEQPIRIGIPALLLRTSQCNK